LRLQLTARDLAILQMVYSYNGVTIEQIHRRFFPHASPNAYYRRVRKLIQAHYLQVSRAPSLSPIGSPLGLITLGKQARPLLSEVLGVPRSELTRATRAASPLVIPHRAAIGDFRLSLELATEATTRNEWTALAWELVELSEWRSEVELASSPIVVRDTKMVFGQSKAITVRIIPDAEFTLTTPRGTVTAYLEMDMGTITARLRDNLRAYLLHRRTLPAPKPILFVVPDEKRAARISEWVLLEARALQADPTIFLITTRDKVQERTILCDPIWRVVGGPPAQALLPRPGVVAPFSKDDGQVLERQVH
jgi:hypothetical protein